jgi:hypothetical protein
MRNVPEPSPHDRHVGAPFFDDLPTGTTFRAPRVTLSGRARRSDHAIVGNRLRLALDADLYAAVTGSAECSPIRCSSRTWRSCSPRQRACACSAISSTAASERGLCPSAQRGGRHGGHRPACDLRLAGIVVLRVRTVDERGEPVLDFTGRLFCPPSSRIRPPPTTSRRSAAPLRPRSPRGIWRRCARTRWARCSPI